MGGAGGGLRVTFRVRLPANRTRDILIRFVAIAALFLVLAVARHAQAEDYDYAKLQSFVSAIMKVSERIEAWRPMIESAPDRETREALVEEADADFAQAVEETEGITSEEYWEIYNDAREDEALRRRIDVLLAARNRSGADP